MVTSPDGPGEPATPPFSGAESRLPPAHGEGSWPSPRPGCLRAGAAPGVPARLENTLARLASHPTRTSPRRRTLPGGARRSHAHSTFAFTSAQGPRSPPRTPALRPLVLGRRQAKAFGNPGWLRRRTPSLLLSRAGVIRNLPLLPAGLHPSLSFPPPRRPRHRYLQSQPGAGEAAKGGGEGSEG